jgi:hypothetical protein
MNTAEPRPFAFDGKAFAEKIAATKRRSWSKPQPPEPEELDAIAEICAVAPESIQTALERGLLYVTTSRDGIGSFVVTDSSRNAAVAYRLDGKPWEAISPRTNQPINRPELYLAGSIPGWPIGLPEGGDFPAIAVVEGGIDLLCALHLIWCASREKLIAPVSLLGHAPIAKSAVPGFQGKAVSIFPHTSTPQEVIDQWSDQLHEAGALEVETYSFGGLITNDEEPVATLRDFVRVSVDQWDGDLRDAIENAFEFGPLTPHSPPT